jgi:hypothetical protein
MISFDYGVFCYNSFVPGNSESVTPELRFSTSPATLMVCRSPASGRSLRLIILQIKSMIADKIDTKKIEKVPLELT